MTMARKEHSRRDRERAITVPLPRPLLTVEPTWYPPAPPREPFGRPAAVKVPLVGPAKRRADIRYDAEIDRLDKGLSAGPSMPAIALIVVWVLLALSLPLTLLCVLILRGWP